VSAVHALAGMLLERTEVNGHTDTDVTRLLVQLAGSLDRPGR